MASIKPQSFALFGFIIVCHAAAERQGPMQVVRYSHYCIRDYTAHPVVTLYTVSYAMIRLYDTIRCVSYDTIRIQHSTAPAIHHRACYAQDTECGLVRS